MEDSYSVSQIENIQHQMDSSRDRDRYHTFDDPSAENISYHEPH